MQSKEAIDEGTIMNFHKTTSTVNINDFKVHMCRI